MGHFRPVSGSDIGAFSLRSPVRSMVVSFELTGRPLLGSVGNGMYGISGSSDRTKSPRKRRKVVEQLKVIGKMEYSSESGVTVDHKRHGCTISEDLAESFSKTE